MVRKSILLAMGLTLFLLCSCLTAEDLIENETNVAAVSETHEETDSDYIPENHEESDEATLYRKFEFAVSDEEILTQYIEAQNREPWGYHRDEESVADFCKSWCVGCEPLYVDGGYIPRCALRHKYTFFFRDFSIDEERWDGSIVDNWWRPDDTRPAWSQYFSSDSSLGWFTVQNDRIILEITDGEEYFDTVLGRISPPRFVHELTTTQWDDFGVQIFQYAGDVTLIGLHDTLSQMSELHEENRQVGFCEEQTAGREILYIYYHELPESKLWNRLMYNS
jgi:hypothetical protein